MSAAKTRAQELIDSKPVVVFSKSYCPHCKNTKNTLKNEYKLTSDDLFVYELDEEDDGAAIQDALQEITGQRSVPNTFIHQKHIGGNDDFQALHKQGQVKALLKL